MKPNPNRRDLIRAALAGATLASVPAVLRPEPVPAPPGQVVAYLPPPARAFVGSPGLAELPDGMLLAKHDLFGPGSTENTVALTRVYRSTDRGAGWTLAAEVRGMYWSNIFTRGPEVFMIGTDRQYGRAVAMRSSDGGATWTRPTSPRDGYILPPGNYHTAPAPTLFHRGRIWRAMESLGPFPHARRFRALVISAPEEADLLDARNWTATNRVRGMEWWLEGKFGGWLEGNAVAAPDGSVVNILRTEVAGGQGRAAVARVSDDGRRLTFDPRRGFIRFPGGEKKFTIRRDPATGLYWSLVNPVGPAERPLLRQGRSPGGIRNTVTLVCSADLLMWKTRAVVLYHPDPARHGFQYLDWLFDGDDLIALARTAWDDNTGGPPRAHDANYLTFHRIKNFRELNNHGPE